MADVCAVILAQRLDMRADLWPTSLDECTSADMIVMVDTFSVRASLEQIFFLYC